MATPVHCIACFEVLDAHHSERKPLSLEEIQSSWNDYTAYKNKDAAGPRNPAVTRVAADAAADSSPTSSASSNSSVSIGGAPSTPASSVSLASVVAGNIPDEAPLFVTWDIADSDDARDGDGEDDEDYNLRGCIGTFQAQPLSEGVPEYALISALQDTRFSPISRREMPRLRVSVTLLTDFEPVDDPYDWVVGTHGVRLSFTDRGRRYGSTYLPDVASEQGWTREEALFSLTRKAGWVGSQAQWRELPLRVTRYQGKKCSVGYGEFSNWRRWVESENGP
ncbi:AMMECR1 [Geosmithia morbida]|uniref:AMMECR1 n=1 Tax=Geosmithia morbida TaxID=1094350 RepID=A0A9P4Z0V9_9HYPO|nr:AMMECR1 [Geosmithia morbida]KAF4126072.1 AMMECR1 [Geosmithia morbida]